MNDDTREEPNDLTPDGGGEGQPVEESANPAPAEKPKPKFDLEAIKARVAAQKAAGEMPQSARAECSGPDEVSPTTAAAPEASEKPKPKIDLEAIKARVAAQKAAGEKPVSAKAAAEMPAASADATGEKPKPKIDLDAIKARMAAQKAEKATESGEGAPAPAAKPAKPAAPPPPALTESQEAEAKAFKDALGDSVLDKGLAGSYLRLTVAPDRIVDAIRYAHDARNYNYLSELTAVDFMAENQFRVVYILANIPNISQTIVIHANISRDEARLPTVTGIFRGADWAEREAYDLFGIEFEGHPDLRRIMLPDEWEGYPLRKDYTFID